MRYAICAIVYLAGCDQIGSSTPKSASGVSKASVDIPVNSDGLTSEQQNVHDRLLLDNKPGSIKHLYLISAFSGDVIYYSTVRGKVTSSGKRLSPTSVSVGEGNNWRRGIKVDIGGENHRTAEVLQDDGTYGSSIAYLYWWDSQGRYHQQYVTGGMILHVSDQPIAVGDTVIKMETAN